MPAWHPAHSFALVRSPACPWRRTAALRNARARSRIIAVYRNAGRQDGVALSWITNRTMSASKIAFLLLCFSAPCWPQPFPQSLYNGLQWRLIGPFRGGRVLAVTGVPGNPATFYMGSVGGGIFKTTDAGTVWKPVFDGQNIASIGAIEVAPSNP